MPITKKIAYSVILAVLICVTFVGTAFAQTQEIFVNEETFFLNGNTGTGDLCWGPYLLPDTFDFAELKFGFGPEPHVINENIQGDQFGPNTTDFRFWFAFVLPANIGFNCDQFQDDYFFLQSQAIAKVWYETTGTTSTFVRQYTFEPNSPLLLIDDTISDTIEVVTDALDFNLVTILLIGVGLVILFFLVRVLKSLFTGRR